MAYDDISSFAKAQLFLLKTELDAEVAETSLLTSRSSPAALQRAGLAITNLSVTSQRTGLGGRAVIELEPDAAIGEGKVQEHGIRTGDIVTVQEQTPGTTKKKGKADDKTVTGVVTRSKGSRISVALNEGEQDVPSKRLWVVKMANDVTFKRMNQVMTKLGDLSAPQYTSLMLTLFGHTPPSLGSSAEEANSPQGPSIEFLDPTLNTSQKNAIRFALDSAEVALIHGPPGTGKTHTLIELARQLLLRDQRLLICGPSNISVDNIVERLATHKVSMVRLGHPARLLPSVLDHSLDVLLYSSDAAAIVRDIRTEMDNKQASIRKTKSGKERRVIYDEMKELRKEYRAREKRCLTTLISSCKVVLATLHGAGGSQLKDQHFDVVIVDEASQALEAQCWVPLFSASKVVLAGDHLQLPPTIKSLNSKAKKADKKEEGDSLTKLTLETTLFDRILALYGDRVKRMLTTQYRMHERIMRLPSDELYEGKLMAAEGVEARLLSELPYGVEETDDTKEPLVFWDTQGGDFPETTEDESGDGPPTKGSILGDSKSNAMEAALVRLHLRKLVQAGVRAEDIAVITDRKSVV